MSLLDRLTALTNAISGDMAGKASTQYVDDAIYTPSWAVSAPKAGAEYVISTDTDWWGWFGTATPPLTDLTVKKAGAGSQRLQLPANGDALLYKTPPFAAIDMSDTSVHFWLRSDDWSAVVGTDIRFSTDNANYFNAPVRLLFSINHFADDEWVEVTLPLSAFDAIGTPSWGSIVDAGVMGWTQGGDPAVVWLNHITIHPTGAKPGAVSLCFDDSWDTSYTNGARIMDQYGYAGTIFSIPSQLGTVGHMTQAQTDDLHDRGWEISGHGGSDLRLLSDTALHDDLALTANWLNVHGYRGAANYAYPNGSNDERVRTAVRKFFGTGRTINAVGQPQGHVCEFILNSIGPWKDMPLARIYDAIDAAVANSEWLILTFHKIEDVPVNQDTEFATANFVAVLDYIKASGVRVDTIGSAF